MHRRRGTALPWLAATLGALLAACAPLEADGGARSGAGTAAGGKTDLGDHALRVLTYNAGLLPGIVGLTEERRPFVADAIRSIGADVVCLQEVWSDADATAIAAALRDEYPHTFRERTTDESFGLLECNLFQLLALKDCVDRECAARGMSAFECVEEGGLCHDAYAPIPLACKHCLAANPGSPVACAFLGAKKYGNEGRNGLLLLSRDPIENRAYKAFHTQLVRRGVLRGDVAGVRVECTHMTSELSSLPYRADERFDSWAAEHLAQVGKLDRNAAETGCTVLAGDLNAGPDGPAGAGELEDNYQALLDLGFRDEWASPRCTYCSENPLVGGSRSMWIDHLLTRGCGATGEWARVLDEPIEVVRDGATFETRISDHYGLVADVGLP